MGAFGINLFLKACDQSSQRNVIDHSDAPKTTATNHYHLFKSLNNYQQVNCGIGRDSVEAWGRKKRSVGGKEETSQAGRKQLGDDMTLSREIVVLDLKEKDPNGNDNGDEAPAGGPRSAASSSDSPAYLLTPGNADDGTTKHCLSGRSLFVLTSSMSLFFVFYVCAVAYFFARRDPKISPIKHQYH